MNDRGMMAMMREVLAFAAGADDDQVLSITVIEEQRNF